jgi:hypothetical protein
MNIKRHCSGVLSELTTLINAPPSGVPAYTIATLALRQ